MEAFDSQIKKKKKKFWGWPWVVWLSLGPAFSVLRLPAFPPLVSKAGGGSRVEASHSAFIPPPHTHPPFGEGDARLGRMACWKSLKYMRVSANTHF